MATMIERQAESIRKEIAKYEARLTREEGRAAKKREKAKALGCAWSQEEFFAHRDVDMTQKQWEAYFDMYSAEHDITRTREALENARRRLEKIAPKVEAAVARKDEQERLSGLEAGWLRVALQNEGKTAEEREREYQEWLAAFKLECLRDGVIILDANRAFVDGITRSGKRFFMSINSGFTARSFHCYTLTVDGVTLFTSGDFSTAYSRIIR